MQSNRFRLGLLLVGVSLLVSCSERGERGESVLPDIDPFLEDTATVADSCEDSIAAIFERDPADAVIPANTTVKWTVQAVGGCSSRYRVQYKESDGIARKVFYDETEFSIRYASGKIKERFLIQSLDEEGSILLEQWFDTDAFTVGTTPVTPTPAPFYCNVLQLNPLARHLDYYGRPLGNAPIGSFVLEAPVPVRVLFFRNYQAPGVLVAPATLPTALGTRHTLSIQVHSLGLDYFDFRVQNEAGQVRDCRAYVSVRELR